MDDFLEMDYEDRFYADDWDVWERDQLVMDNDDDWGGDDYE